ncbi:hypothetical protein KIPB_001638 [Kipferlia bialata]|uniref:PDEase domain-containing protein n=1 Tax=Kipferlia bialata TaxID=797122 RepID=A0A9K3CP94_9EUKA|nr:hypothetical protein KIPB_001638 [Kipferlia bialata]|eukprot:g1638.t1
MTADPTFLVMHSKLHALGKSVRRGTLYSLEHHDGEYQGFPDAITGQHRHPDLLDTSKENIDRAILASATSADMISTGTSTLSLHDALDSEISTSGSFSWSPSSEILLSPDPTMEWKVPYPRCNIPEGYHDHHMSMDQRPDGPIVTARHKVPWDNARPLRGSYMMAYRKDARNSACITVYRSWLDLLGVHGHLKEINELSAFPKNVHPEDLAETYAALESAEKNGIWLAHYRQLVPTTYPYGKYVHMRSIGHVVRYSTSGRALLLAGYAEKMPHPDDFTVTSGSSCRDFGSISECINASWTSEQSAETHQEVDSVFSTAVLQRMMRPASCPYSPSHNALDPDAHRKTFMSMWALEEREKPPRLPADMFRRSPVVTCDHCVDQLLIKYHKMSVNKKIRASLVNAATNENFDAALFDKQLGGFGFGLHRNNPFHNAIHSLDTLQISLVMMYSIEKCPGGTVWMPSVLRALTMLSAVCLNIDHPGLSKDYLVGTDNPVATAYGRERPIQMQASTLAAAVFRGCNILPRSTVEINLVRDLIVSTSCHSARDTLFQLRRLTALPYTPAPWKENELVSALVDRENGLGHVQYLTARSVLMVASMGCMAREWPIAEVFGRLRMREEYASGAHEADAGLIVPPCRMLQMNHSTELDAAMYQAEYVREKVLPHVKTYTHHMRRLGIRGAELVGERLTERAVRNRERWLHCSSQ